MLVEELMKEEYNAGKAEGLELGKAEGLELGKAEGLEAALGNAREVLMGLLCEIAPISDNLKDRISSIKELESIMQLTAKVTKVNSLEAFEKELEKMGY